MKIILLSRVLGFAFLYSLVSTTAQTVLTGDHVIEAGTSDTGSLTVGGSLQVEGNRADLGTTSDDLVGLQFLYEQDGAQHRGVLLATKAQVEFLWKENGAATSKTKLKLGADNALTLYDSSGQARIELKPVSGEIKAHGGFRLPDGTLLSGASSLRSTALYDSIGRIVAKVGESSGNGIMSMSIGEYSTATGNFSFAAGPEAVAEGGGSFAFGNSSYAYGPSSFSAGSYNFARGFGSVALGGAENYAGGGLFGCVGE